MNQDPHENHDAHAGAAGYEGYDEQGQYAYDQDDPYGGYGHADPYANEAESYAEEPYQEDESWAQDEADMAPPPPKKGMPKALMAALGGVAALLVGVGGLQMAAPEVLEGINPMALVASMAGGEESSGEAPPSDQGEGQDATPQQPRPKPKPAQAVKPTPKATAKPAQAAKPSPKATAKPAQAAKPSPKATPKAAQAAKPSPKATPKPVQRAKAPAGAPGLKVGIAFASGSYWVSAGEMESLWAYSRKLPAGGTLVVESWAGGESNGQELAQKRAERVAELMRDHHALGARVKVVLHGDGPARRVRISHKP